MILKYFYRWSSVLLLIPGIVLANQGGNRESPANDWKTCYQESGLPFLCGSKPPAIDWEACYRESGLPFLCGSVDVPLDYNAPEGGKLNLALIKLPAAMEKTKSRHYSNANQELNRSELIPLNY